jgi:hypothetical protein
VLLRLAYLGVTNTLAMLRLLPMSDRAKDAEILALRHQISRMDYRHPQVHGNLLEQVSHIATKPGAGTAVTVALQIAATSNGSWFDAVLELLDLEGFGQAQD